MQRVQDGSVRSHLRLRPTQLKHDFCLERRCIAKTNRTKGVDCGGGSGIAAEEVRKKRAEIELAEMGGWGRTSWELHRKRVLLLYLHEIERIVLRNTKGLSLDLALRGRDETRVFY